MLRASPELVILARNGHKIAVFYLLCVTIYKYATNTENSFVKLKYSKLERKLQNYIEFAIGNGFK